MIRLKLSLLEAFMALKCWPGTVAVPSACVKVYLGYLGGYIGYLGG